MADLTIGNPARGQNFYNRHIELKRLWEYVVSDHLLVLAPRRVGKSSLLLRAQDKTPNGYQTIYCTVAKGIEDERGFVESLYKELAGSDKLEALLKSLKKGKFAHLFEKVQSFKLFEVEVALREQKARANDWQQLGAALIEGLQATGDHWLLMIDEFPVFVLKLLQQDPTGNRARTFLEWFRDLRQGPHDSGIHHVRWILAGSIGLDSLSRHYKFTDTINDLRVFSIDGFSLKDACGLLEDLATSSNLKLSTEIQQQICQKIGWTIPYYLQIVFAELKTLCEDKECEPSAALVDEAYEVLFTQSHRNYFDYWHQRLENELGNPRALWAKVLLAHCARNDGRTRSQLEQMLLPHIADTEQREAELSLLLDLLEGDGYLTKAQKQFRFRSPLLLAYWLRRILGDE